MNEFMNAPDQDVALISRIRLARNYEDMPFRAMMNSEDARLLETRASEAVICGGQGDAFETRRIRDLSTDESQQLADRFLISNDLIKYADTASVLISSGETISIMVGEEDHLRILGLLPGLQLERAADLAFMADGWLEKGGKYAFDSQFGYLTSCPTNAGTGLRGSIVLHLPMLRAAGQIGRVVQEVARLGLTLRGLYSDGNEADGNLYQLSNHASLGRTEEDVLRSLIAACSQVIAIERGVREKMLSQDGLPLLDRLYRTIGVLRSARLVSAKEWMQRWSDLRLAAVAGLVDAPLTEIDRMRTDLQNASMDAQAGKTLSDRERDAARAEILRKKMAEMEDALSEI